MAKSFQEAGLYGGQEMDTLREKLQEKLKREIDRPAIREVDPRAGLAVVLVVALVAAGVGFVIFRRRRITLAKRLQSALPDVDELRASIKKPLERVVRAL
jgi:hypothetical protein